MHPDRFAALSLLLWLAVSASPSASFEAETAGEVSTLPPVSDHWIFIPDRLLEHSFLFDADRGEMLASIPSPAMLTPKLPLVARTRGEIYSVDIDYDRGVRGKRIDYVTIYDAATLDIRGEVLLRPPTSMSNTSLHHAALLDGERFLAVFSQFPATLASIVDLEKREVVSEIQLAGCAGVYAAGPDRFGTLCGDGTSVMALLDEEGHLRGIVKSEKFFDVVDDPVAMAGARWGAKWLFASFEGQVHEVDYSGDAPTAQAAWPLATEAERADGWRPGGLQPVALHGPSKRLYVLMHRGGSGTHKDPGRAIWVYPLETKSRVDTIAVPNLSADFLGPLLGVESGGFAQWLLRAVVPDEGAHSIAVTQDDDPLLFARHGEVGVVAVLDAETGEHLRNLEEVGLAGPTLGVP